MNVDKNMEKEVINKKMLQGKYDQSILNSKSTNIYPVLPSAPPDEGRSPATSGHVYRLQKISEIQKEIENERERKTKLSKKYHRPVRISVIMNTS